MKKAIAVALSVVVVGAVGVGIYSGVQHSKEDTTEVAVMEKEEVPLAEKAEETKTEEVKEEKVAPVMSEETQPQTEMTHETVEEETEDSQEESEENDVFEEDYDKKDLTKEAIQKEETPKEASDENKYCFTVTPDKNGQLLNGDFKNGITDFEVYGFEQQNIDYSTSDSDGFSMMIKDTGSEDWYVQLKQTGIRLEKDRWYRLTFDAKSTIGRDIVCTLQRNGLYDDDWTPYSESLKCSLGSDWNTFTVQFKMTHDTDEDVVFNLSMGTINGNRIIEKHFVNINHIKLETLDDNWTDSLRSEDNLLGNTLFAYNGMLWETSVVTPGESNTYFENGTVVFDITNPGTVDWHVQLKQQDVKLKKDQGYLFICAVESTVARTIKVGFMDTNYVDWYGGADVELQPGVNVINVPFKNEIRDNDNCVMMISMGQIEGVVTPAGKLILHSLSLVEKEYVHGNYSDYSAGSNNQSTYAEPSHEENFYVDPIHNLTNGFFVYDHESSHTQSVSVDGENGYKVQINNTGTEDWHVQLQKKNNTLEKEKWYKIAFDAKSTLNRNIMFTMQRDGSNDNDWRAYSLTGGEQKVSLTDEWSYYEQIFQMTQDTDNNVIFNVSMGTIDGNRIAQNHSVWIKNIVFEEAQAPQAPEVPEIAAGEQMLNNPTFENNGAGWDGNVNELANANVSFNDGKAVFDINNPGSADWHVQLVQKGLSFEQGYKYRMTFNASSTATRDIKLGFMQDGTYDWFGGADFTLQAVNSNARQPGVGEYAAEFIMDKPSITNGMVAITMGKIEGKDTPASVVTISDVKLVKSEVEQEQEPEGLFVINSSDEQNTDNGSTKWLVNLDPNTYNSDVKEGDRIKVTAKLYSEKAFQAMIGSCYTENWAWIDTGVTDIEGGVDYELTLTVENYKGALQLQIPTMEGDKVIVKEIRIEIVEEEEPENLEESGEEGQKPSAVVIFDDTYEKTDNVWKYEFNPGDFSGETDFAGKKVKISAVLYSDGEFTGLMGACYGADWAWTDKLIAGEANTDNSYEFVVENFTGESQIQVHRMSGTYVAIKSIDVSVIDEPQPTGEETIILAIITETESDEEVIDIQEEDALVEEGSEDDSEKDSEEESEDDEKTDEISENEDEIPSEETEEVIEESEV